MPVLSIANGIGPKGDRGFNGNDGRTPIKGVDYFDGGKGDKGDEGNPGTTDYAALSNKPDLSSLHASGSDNQNLSELVVKITGKGLSTNDYTTAEQTKLSGIETSANNYTHPANHAPSIITQDASNRFVSDTEKSTWNGKEAGNSNIQTHVGSAHAPSTAQANADITKAEIEAKLTGTISTHTHAEAGQAIGLTVLANDTLAQALAANINTKITVTASRTLTTTVPAAGVRCSVVVLTSGTNTYTITFGSGFKPTGTLATGTTTARVFVVNFISDGTNLYEAGRTAAMVA